MSLEEQLRNDAQSLREVGWFNRAIMMDAAANEIQKLNERIKRLEEAHSWRLIETAPSDYTWILGYDEKHGETGMIIFERGDESEPHWTDGMREWEPTHWMPLPEEPKAKEAKL